MASVARGPTLGSNWRLRSESNRRPRLCRPLHNHSATQPKPCEGSSVTAEVASHGRHDKVKIIKFRRRKHHMKRQGHRQWFTELKIVTIPGSGSLAAEAEPEQPTTAPTTDGAIAAED
jgi:hypothetical protein